MNPRCYTGNRPDVLLAVAIDIPTICPMPRLLKEAGVEVSLIAPPFAAVRWSRFVDHHVRWPPESRNVAEALLWHLRRPSRPYRRVILGDESLVWSLVDEPEVSGAASWLPFPLNQKHAGISTSKFGFMEAARDAGLLVPDFRVVNGLQEVRSVARDFGFPVVVKSAHGAAASGVRVARNTAEVDRAHEEIGGGEGLMLQEFIYGREGETPVLFDRGTPLCWFSTYNDRAWPSSLGACSSKELMRHKEVAVVVDTIGKLTEFSGFCGIDWFHDYKRNRLIIIEFNPRPTPGMFLAKRLKASVPQREAIHVWASGRGRVEQRPDGPFVPRSTPVFPQAVFRSVADRNLAAFLHTFTCAPWSDPLLLAAQLRRIATHYLPSSFRSGTRELLWKIMGKKTAESEIKS